MTFFFFAKAINHDFDRNINNFCLEGQSRITALQPVTFVKDKGRLFYCFLYEGFLVSHQPYPTVGHAVSTLPLFEATKLLLLSPLYAYAESIRDSVRQQVYKL